MVIQLIFFLSVVALIALLLRRGTINTTGQSVKLATLQAFIGKSFARVGSLVIGLWQIINTRLFSRPKKISPPRVAGLSEGEFWKEGDQSARPELPGRYDEGEALFKQGKLEEAERFFIDAATHNPSDPKIYAKLGLIYLQQQNYSDAIESLKIATKLDKHNPSRHYNLALAYWGNNDLSRAIPAVREAISLDPVTQKYRDLLDQLLNRQHKDD